MSGRGKLGIVFSILVGVVLASGILVKADSLPDSLSAAILVRVVGYENSVNRGDRLRIHVLDSASLAEELEAYVGSPVGARSLSAVTVGAITSDLSADVVVATKSAGLKLAVDYARRSGAVSVTTDPSLVGLGVSLIIFDDEGMPGIFLNAEAARRDGLQWEPEILEVAKIAGD